MSISHISNKGQYLHGPGQLRLEDRPLSSIGPSDVRIRIRATTLCGSDVHYFKYGKNGSIEVKEPLCGGHEAAGEVVEVGAAARVLGKVQVGDKVAVESGVPCQECPKCEDGRYNICSKLRFRSSGASFPHFQGTLQEYIDHPAEWCHRLPDALSFDDGALLEPLSVSIHAVNRTAMKEKSRCLVFGAGAVGLLCAAVAKIEHNNSVAIADIDQGRVQFALDHGFADTGFVVVPRQGKDLKERLSIAKELSVEIAKLKWPGGKKWAGLSTYLNATDNGGNIVLVGMGTPVQSWPIAEITGREINIVSVWRYVNCYPRAIEIVEAVRGGVLKPDVTKLITHRFTGIQSVPLAYATASNTRDKESRLIIKTVVNF
ncbi:hypothetical protein N7499_009148 [Penicillium canescens]|nr:hypothetical protein N7499_009148 [Penicillium canescens]KAJ6169817.1 hypothetical protein N7485_007163 [Penicillium canescens]